MSIRCAELFAGAGLMGAGFANEGFESIFAAELDHRAVATYNLNLKPVAECWDAGNVKKGLVYEVLVAGPPCQGFSTLGKRDPLDHRNGLSLNVYDWAAAHKPLVVVIENVPQFLKSIYWQELNDRFASDNYECVTWVLDSSNYGCPQKRIRSFTIFSKIGLPTKPVQSKKIVTVKEAFRGLSEKADGKNFHIAPEPTELGLARIKLIPPNGDKRDILRIAPGICPPSWEKMGNAAVDVWGRMDWNKPSNTLRCEFQNPSKGRYLHPVEDRVISLREGARLQGIPDSWEFSGERTSVARQIGNGVPVPLARAVAKSIKELFNSYESSSFKRISSASKSSIPC